MPPHQFPDTPSLYPILDLDYCSEKNIDPDILVSFWSDFREYIPFIQIRAKSHNVKNFTLWYRELHEKNPEFPLILNDHWEVAIKESAFGFHIGKEDFQFLPEEERDIIRSSSQFKGTSSHSLEDLKNLESLVWNYSGIGPIFSTSTKVSENKILGPEFLLQAKETTTIPLVPIGGITAENIQEIFHSGNFLVGSIGTFTDKKEFLKIISILQGIKNPDQKP